MNMVARGGMIGLAVLGLAVGLAAPMYAEIVTNKLSVNRLSANGKSLNGNRINPAGSAGEGAVSDVIGVSLPNGVSFTR